MIRWPLAALVGLLAGTARASEPTRVIDDPCLAAYALDGLTTPEQHGLATACRAHTAPTGEQAPLLARLVARGDWGSTVLADLLAAAAPLLDVGADDPTTNRLRLARDALAQLRGQLATCNPVQLALDNYFKSRDAGDLTSPPFTDYTLARCPGFAGDALAGLALLTIAADEPATDLFVSAGAGDRTVLQWLAPADAFVHQGRRVFVVAVPRWSVVSVRSTTAPAPQRWHGYVSYHQAVWNDPPATSCLRLSVDLDPDMILLLDGRSLTAGRPIAHRTVSVRAGAHGLVALQCKPTAQPTQCTVRYREVLPAIDASARDNLCRDVALDLHQRRSVAVLQARAAPGCDAAVAWRAGELAREHLRQNQDALDRSFRDLASYASITEALGHLRADLNPDAGQAVGASTGADSLDQIASVAKEAWRQGIDELVSLELRCDAAGLDLKATAISARELFERQLGPVAGAELKDLLRVQTLGFPDEKQLASTVAAVLDQLFERRYVHFREGRTRFSYREPGHLELVSDHSFALLTVVRRVNEGRLTPRAEVTCERQLRSKPATLLAPDMTAVGPRLAHDRRRSAGQPIELRDGVAWRHDLTFRAPRPGSYLVGAWSGAAGTAELRCLSFEVPARELWGTAMFSPDIAFRTPITQLIARHVRVTLGHTWYFKRRPWLGLGVHGGYNFTSHKSREGVPAWQDLTVDAALRTASLTWSRHSLVVGPLLEFRSRRGDLPVEFRGRLSAGVGVALVDVRDIDAFADFSGSEYFGTANTRVRPTLDATAELGVGGFIGPVSVTPLLTIGAAALNDMTAGRWAVSAVNGAAMYFGIGLLLGGSR